MYLPDKIHQEANMARTTRTQNCKQGIPQEKHLHESGWTTHKIRSYRIQQTYYACSAKKKMLVLLGRASRLTSKSPAQIYQGQLQTVHPPSTGRSSQRTRDLTKSSFQPIMSDSLTTCPIRSVVQTLPTTQKCNIYAQVSVSSVDSPTSWPRQSAIHNSSHFQNSFLKKILL